MKIGIDLRSLQEKERAGIGRYVYQLCESLVKQDKENDYFFYFNASRKIHYPEFTKYGTIVHTRIPSKLFNFCSRYLRCPAWDKKQGLDIFWQPSFNFIKLSKQVTKVLTVHDLSWMIDRRWYSSKMLLWHSLQNIVEKIESAEKIVAVSQSTAADLQYFFKLNKDKIKVVYSGINREVFNNISQVAKLPDNYLLFIGAIEPRKNVLGVLQAWERIYDKYPEHKNVHFVIMGASGWSNKMIHQAIQKSKYRDRFHYVGYATNEERDYGIRNSKALVWPSFYEGFGHPPLETLWRNKKVITGHGSSLPEVMKNNAILIDPYNISDIMKAILEVLENSSTGNNAHNLIEKYTWDNAAQEYLKIFNSLKK